MDEQESEKPFAVEKAKTGRAKCKKCKLPIDKDTVRIAKLMANPFGEGKMKAWHHVTCLFEVFAKQRASTRRLEDPEEDVDGWEHLEEEDKKIVIEHLEEFDKNAPFKKKRSSSPAKNPPAKKRKSSPPPAAKDTPEKPSPKNQDGIKKTTTESDKKSENRDNAFREYRRVCANIANASAYTEKTAIVKKMFSDGAKGNGFKGDVVLWCKMLLPMANKKIYNLQSKALIKLFARILQEDEQDMLEDLEQGDVAETIQKFFDKNDAVKANAKSLLSLQEVEEFLSRLSDLTKEDEQISHFKSILPKCTPNDLKMIIRLIKRDLRINCGPKHILEAVGSEAYKAYQVSNDLEAVVRRFVDKTGSKNSTESSSVKSKVSLALMTPVLPMLAEACTSVEMAMKKCPNGMLSEIKYDGERVQVHKRGTEFRYFSRSLKPVLPHKVNHFKEYIPKAFPDGDDLILDCEILMIDTKTGQPLPFGTLGVHKKAEFKDANVCIFIFDCIYYNGEVLMNKTMKERRKILTLRMTTIPNRVMLSEVQQVHDPKDLAEMIAKVLKMGLEGLVLKDMNFVRTREATLAEDKKDYLLGGAMADSADLVVLGAWYGTGNKGGMKSIFLMGCYDEDRDKWLTVTKVHSGHDDDTLAKLQDQLEMVKIGKDPNLVPGWLRANKPMIPDFVAKDPKKQPVWEITGAEFTNQGVHTADGISIRFPRVTRIRDDKDWKTATSLKELKKLFEKSSDSIDFSLLLGKPSTSGRGTGDKGGKQDVDDSNKADEDNVTIKGQDSTNSDDGDNDNDNDDEEKSNIAIKLKASGQDRKQDNKNNKRKRPVDVEEGQDSDKESDNYTSGCSSTGSSSKAGIKDFKSKKKYPEDAEERLSEECHSPAANGILKHTYIVLSNDLSDDRQKVLSRSLITLGATVRKESSFDAKQATHIIHRKTEISEEELRRFKTVSARHVTESWVKSTTATSVRQEEIKHAVNLRGSYCQCKCPHRKED